MRILAGVGAWLFGAGTATAGSLLAVSLLGQGIAASPSQQLTAAAVNRALARESREPRPGRPRRDPVTLAHVWNGPARRDPHHGAPTRPGLARVVHRDRAPRRRRATSPGPQAAAGTVLTSPGGTVLAECLAAGTYLVSWSPTQGYETSDVTGGRPPRPGWSSNPPRSR